LKFLLFLFWERRRSDGIQRGEENDS
jgi:hypothetical protein